jgi:hypothetical protein
LKSLQNTNRKFKQQNTSQIAQIYKRLKIDIQTMQNKNNNNNDNQHFHQTFEYETMRDELSTKMDENRRLKCEIESLNTRLIERDNQIANFKLDLDSRNILANHENQQKCFQIEQELNVEKSDLLSQIEQLNDKLNDLKFESQAQMRNEVEQNALIVGNLRLQNEQLTKNINQLTLATPTADGRRQ